MAKSRTRVLRLGLLAVVAACSDAGGDAPDAEVGSDEEGDPRVRENPLDYVDLPVFTPCPSGWNERALTGLEGVTVCEPWPQGDEAPCAADEARFPGQAACVLLGTPCQSSDLWAEDLPSDGEVLYVRSGAGAGGDGTREAPFASIAEAVQAASPDAVVALSQGTFDEAVVLPDGVTLWGACVGGTLVASSTPSEEAGTITVSGTSGAIRNLQVGGERPGIWITGASSVELTDILIDGTVPSGLRVSDASQVVGHGLIVRDTRQLPADRGIHGMGIDLSGAESHVELTRVVVEGGTGIGIQAHEVSLQLSQVVVRGIAPGTVVDGIPLTGGLFADGPVEVTQGLFECLPFTSLLVGQSSLSLTDVVVRGPAGEPACEDGLGLFAAAQAEVRLDRVLFERKTGVAIFSTSHASLTLTDVVMRQSRVDRPSGGAAAMLLDDGAGAVLDRVLVEGMVGTSLLAQGSETTMTATNLWVNQTDPLQCDPVAGCGESHFSFAMGIVVVREAAIDLSRFALTNHALCALQMAGPADLRDGLMAHNAIAVAVQVPGFDVSRLEDGVRYVDNERTVDFVELPIPDLTTFLE